MGKEVRWKEMEKDGPEDVKKKKEEAEDEEEEEMKEGLPEEEEDEDGDGADEDGLDEEGGDDDGLDEDGLDEDGLDEDGLNEDGSDEEDGDEEDGDEDELDEDGEGIDAEALGAVGGGMLEILQQKNLIATLLQSGKAGKNELREASKAGNLAEVEDLLKNEEWRNSINDGDIYDYTALHMACEEGHAHVVRALLDAGADVEAVTKMHQSRPMHYAAFNGHVDVIQRLASFNGNPEVVELLLKMQANPHQKDKFFRTPAKVASGAETREVFDKFLAKNGEKEEGNSSSAPGNDKAGGSNDKASAQEAGKIEQQPEESRKRDAEKAELPQNGPEKE